MSTLSSHYAVLTLPNGEEVEPISVSVTADETWAPYIQASVVVPSNLITQDIDPRQGTRLKLRLQQDFGDLVYVYEITADYTGDVSAITAAFGGNIDLITKEYTEPWNIFEAGLPISTVTTAYAPVTPLKLTNANLSAVWLMTKFLQDEGSFNPASSTIFQGDLGVRSINYDYVSKEATIELSSDEALTQDVHGYGDDVMMEYPDARSLINEVLSIISASLEFGEANYFYVGQYQLQKYEFNLPNTAWDFIETITQAAGLKLYCDEQRQWYLIEPTAVSGDLVLNDNDNITAFTKEISRDKLWYNQVVVQYETISDGVIWDNYYEFGTGPIRTLFERKSNIEFPGMGAAQSIAQRTLTRGETYTIEAIANFDARPRQTLTVDITGEPIKTGVVQSITWSLPSARMSVDIRDLQEVI
jgi:hypothetical protein